MRKVLQTTRENLLLILDEVGTKPTFLSSTRGRIKAENWSPQPAFRTETMVRQISEVYEMLLKRYSERILTFNEKTLKKA